MKVGIITYHRAHNYGAVLQCYALQEVLRKIGHEVEVIDYRQAAIERLYIPSKVQEIRKSILHPHNLYALRSKFAILNARKEKFEFFCSKYLHTSKSCFADSIPAFEAYIVGSDQMWSLACVGGSVDPVYFGMFDRPMRSKLLGFSISSNNISINELGRDRLTGYINNFNAVSVREQHVADSIFNLTGISLPVTLDPTLCAGSELWNKVLDDKWKNKKYVAVYHVKLRFASVAHKMILNQAIRIAKEMNCEVVDLSSGEYSVQDFVSVIRYAECVVTSSFHATVFSVIFQRPLFSIRLHDGNDGRYIDLLNGIGMNKALVDLDFTDKAPSIFDYNEVQRSLNTLRQPSVEYLITNLNA